MTVLVMYTLPPEDPGIGRLADEFDLAGAAGPIAAALPDAVTVAVRGEAEEVLDVLRSHRPEVVFNLCEAPLGDPALEAHAASLFEWYGVRFTGSGSETLALCRHKPRVDAMLAASGVPVPRTAVFPCVVKPSDEDGSAGIDANSVCANAAERDAAAARLGRPCVVQEFLPGREFAVALWGQQTPDFDSIGETEFLNGLMLNTYAAKWDADSADYANSLLHYDSTIESSLRDAVLAAARGAWRVVGARGYLRVDIRLDREGRPRVIDVNPNPEIVPDRGMSRAVVEAGWAWEDFIRALVAWA